MFCLAADQTTATTIQHGGVPVQLPSASPHEEQPYFDSLAKLQSFPGSRFLHVEFTGCLGVPFERGEFQILILQWSWSKRNRRNSRGSGCGTVR